MLEPLAYKKFAILYVDDEELARETFVSGYEDRFRILTAGSAREGLKILEEKGGEIGILLTDQQMPGEKGIWLLEKARELCPRVLRILITAYPDMRNVIDAVNSGAIFKYVTKPWEPRDFRVTLQQGMEFFLLQHERDELLRERMLASRAVSVGLISTGMSQQIRTSLVSVKTLLDLLSLNNAAGKPESAAIDADFVKNIRLDIERTLDFLNDLRLVSAGNSHSAFTDQIQVGSIFEAALAQMHSAFSLRRIEIQNQISKSLPAIPGLKSQLSRLAELFLKFELAMLPSGSRLALTAETLGKQLTLRFTDTGPALPEESLRMILDPFAVSNASPREYDILLMICFFIVHHHGGTMEAQSRPEGGNQFKIHLPLAS